MSCSSSLQLLPRTSTRASPSSLPSTVTMSLEARPAPASTKQLRARRRGSPLSLFPNWRLPVPIRKARLQDAEKVHALVNSLSGDGTLLSRPFAEICENIRDFTVAESNSGEFQGCGALHLYGPHLAEVRSLVVRPEWKGC